MLDIMTCNACLVYFPSILFYLYPAYLHLWLPLIVNREQGQTAVLWLSALIASHFHMFCLWVSGNSCSPLETSFVCTVSVAERLTCRLLLLNPTSPHCTGRGRQIVCLSMKKSVEFYGWAHRLNIREIIHFWFGSFFKVVKRGAGSLFI